eukprot:Protomagalhaensia_sp_Gyna_25__349@NODE_1163_length_2120_cov_24_105718_g922_i0_p1_GENE_NODE_1163_length_2120_cov_24_105718_g922_i0NODE_1163_length_2120_cov_24_105718_g922_i0_p1_ORF_typecomplete_len437_score63_08mRNA_triPase/PF02940_15/3_3e29_NODE_1163_length_2120_cov_24_105718_g922_i07922102
MQTTGTLLDGTKFLGALEDPEDAVTREVVSQVEYSLDKFNLAAQYTPGQSHIGEHIEVEGRLGVFLDPYSNERLKLPIETESLLLPPSQRGFGYKFASSVSKYHFECFARTLCKEFGLADSELSVQGTFHKPVSREVPMETLDVFVVYQDDVDAQDEDARVRISLHPEGKGILEAIRKQPFQRINVYSGRDMHEDEVQVLINESGEYTSEGEDLRTAVDFRVSINKEINVPLDVAQKLLNRDSRDQFQRRRSRKSYPIFGLYRVDCTTVRSNRGKGQSSHVKQSFEIELEINPYALYHHYLKKQRGDPSHKFDAIIANFVEILRHWVAFLNTNGSTELLTFKKSSTQSNAHRGTFSADLCDCAPSPDALQNYLAYVSPVVPILGDYAFRCVTAHSQHQGTALTEQDIQDSIRLHLTAEELQKLQEKAKERLMAVAM